MLPLAMPPPIIPVRSCGATGCIRCSAAGTGLPLLFHLSPANVHDAPFARPLLELAVRLLALRPRVVRLDAGYWGLTLIAWIHTTLHARAVIPWNPKRQKRQKRRDGGPPHLDRRGVGPARQQRALFRPRPGLLPLPGPASVWLVPGRNARGPT